MANPQHKYLKCQSHTTDMIESLRSRRVVIYGGGKIGTRILRSLRSYGIEPVAVWDVKAEVVGQIDGIAVSAPDVEAIANREDTTVIVTIYSENVCSAVAADLRSRGVQEVISKRAAINAILYLECHTQLRDGQFTFDYATCHMCPVAKEMPSRCDIYSRHLAQRVNTSPETLVNATEEPFVIPSMGVLVTNNCNLTCEGCNHLRDHYKPSDNVRIETQIILDDLQRVIDAVDLIEKVVIVGGEAFVHNDIYNIIARILELRGIGLVQIITNGTVIPKNPRLFELLATERMMVEISGYGNFLPEKLQANVKQFVSLLEQHEVRYTHLETLEWQDFGGFEYRGYSPKQHLRVYKTCCFVSNDMFDGKLFKCSRSVFATRLGKIPGYSNDYVDVRNTPAAELRERLIAFFENKHPEVCQHCDGTSDKRMPAGSQLAKGNLPIAAPLLVDQNLTLTQLSIPRGL